VTHYDIISTGQKSDTLNSKLTSKVARSSLGITIWFPRFY